MKMKNLENGNEWMWDRNKFINRKYLMQEMYQNYSEGDTDWDWAKVRATSASTILHILVRNFFCNVNDMRALIGLSPSDVTLRRDSKPLGLPGLHYSTYGDWSLATYPLFYSSKILSTPFVFLYHLAEAFQGSNDEFLKKTVNICSINITAVYTV